MNENIFALILAGGIGSRMGADLPKQYIEVSKKPIIIHTIEKFLSCENIDGIIVMTPADWVDYTNDLIVKHFPGITDKITVAIGGSTRNDTLMNAINCIENQGFLTEKTIILTHDAVRPFINKRIIQDNIDAVRKFGSCVTCVGATDTIAVSEDNQYIDHIPDRRHMYQVQTPQSFYAAHLRALHDALTPEEKEILTDATKIYSLNGEKVHLVDGEVYNIKITYPHDIALAEAILSSPLE